MSVKKVNQELIVIDSHVGQQCPGLVSNAQALSTNNMNGE